MQARRNSDDASEPGGSQAGPARAPRQPPLVGAPLKAAVVDRATALGFDLIRVAAPDSIPRAAERLQAWLSAGRHGTMGWMAETPERRADPRTLWGEVRRVVMVGLSYAPPYDPIALLGRRESGLVSAYAARRDYHEVIKGRLKEVAGYLAARGGAEVKVFVDTAPVMEKPLAEAAGLGWIGKHSVLVSREHGSWLFLGAIYTSADLPIDEPEQLRCGSCRRCLDVCPTNAFPAPHQLDARRCIAYLTIEHKGPIAREFRHAIGNRIYGCDDCLAVCPWNKFADAAAANRAFAARAELVAPELADLLDLDDAGFRQIFAGSPIKRIGRDRMVRNALVSAGNSGLPALVPQVANLLGDADPAVRGAAAWALARLDPDRFAAERKVRLVQESDENVRSEWLTHFADALPQVYAPVA